MSFILDALRKSESERQREAAPSLARAPLAQVRHRVPAWMWALTGILLAALIGLGAVWWQSGANERPAPGSDATLAPPVTRVPGLSSPSGSQAAPDTGPAPDAPATLRSINELASFGPNLPDYRLELLAYDEADPASGYARINGRRYEPGDRIGGGPELVEVRPDGVVLGYAGERFLLTAR